MRIGTALQTMAILGPIVVIAVLLLARSCTYREIRDRKYITDSGGRALILHGMNVNGDAKSDPLRVGWITEEGIRRLSAEWGFNLMRYLVLWDGIEPTHGSYDYRYFDRIEERLDWAEKAGVRVVIDFHQDLYSIRFGGDGAPNWAVFDDGLPAEPQTPWELTYRQPGVIASIRNFWDLDRGHPELQDRYVAMVKETVRRLTDHPAVLGFDLYNEPTLATLYGLFRFERDHVRPFYQRLIDEIRTVDTDTWIFYEPTALGANQGFRSRLGTFVDPRPGEPRLAYFPHLYTLDLDISDKYIGRPLFLNKWAASRRKEILRQDAPMLVGEFGLNGDQPRAEEYLEDALAMMDKVTSGWTYWIYAPGGAWSPVNRDLSEKPMMDLFVRPYPRAVAGQPIGYRWNPEKGEFLLEFRQKADVAGATEIYLPDRCFPNGWDVELSDNRLKTDWDEDSRILYVDTAESGLDTLSVRVTGIGRPNIDRPNP
jgi:endoglycosylceramidase